MKEYERVSITKHRLKQAMDAANKKQADLVRDTGLNRGTISRYLSGEVEPRQDATYKLAAALGVNEMWLWGYDVPMQRNPSKTKNDQLAKLVVRMREDPDFFEVVSIFADLEPKDYESVKSIVLSLGKK